MAGGNWIEGRHFCLHHFWQHSSRCICGKEHVVRWWEGELSYFCGLHRWDEVWDLWVNLIYVYSIQVCWLRCFFCFLESPKCSFILYWSSSSFLPFSIIWWSFLYFWFFSFSLVWAMTFLLLPSMIWLLGGGFGFFLV